MKDELITREGELVKELERVRAEIKAAEAKPRSRYRRQGPVYYAVHPDSLESDRGVAIGFESQYCYLNASVHDTSEDITCDEFAAAWTSFLNRVNSLEF